MFSQKIAGVFMIVVLATLVSCEHNTDQQGQKSCTDDEGNIIPDGEEFIPKISDPCTKCTCDNGYQIMCHTAACSPPEGCVKTEPIPRECCKYHCLDADGNSQSPSGNNNGTHLDGVPTENEDNITNLSLRLVASTVTSFLVLALLLFMVHRLRQRRLMLAMRRFEAQARGGHGDDDLDHYIPAEFMQIECPPYEDPPPPYSPPKPPHILPEEAPPPYEEVENSGGTQLDTNGNINNNNNNNQSANNGSDGVANSARENQHQVVIERGVGSPHVAELVEGFSANPSYPRAPSCGGRSGIERVSVVGNLTRSSGPAEDDLLGSRDSVDQTCVKSVARLVEPRQGYREPVRVNDSIQKHSVVTNHDRRLSAETGQESCFRDRSEMVAAVQELQRRGSDHGSGLRWSRQPGRSCSFSCTRSPDQDEMSGIVLSPMSHSYHAATTESGVQTHGSYTASLSRRKARAGNRDTGQTNTISEDGEVGTSQRMIRKPIMGCDSAVEQSHRMLQEELLKNLPPKQAGISEGVPTSTGAPTDSCGNISPRPEPDGDDFSSTDQGAGARNTIPRSQSVTSALSVCSETGEVRSKKTQGDTDGSVLQSDCQYPDQHRPSHHQTFTSDTDPAHSNKPISDLSAVRSSPQASRPMDLRSEASGCSTKPSLTLNARRPVPNPPPSQELRPGLASSRAHTSKPKHGKKIHFVPLEKSKTYKAGKKEKSKSKKGGASAETQVEENSPQVSGEVISHAHPLSSAYVQDSNQHSVDSKTAQPKTGEVRRGRSSAQPSVKQYGFLEHFGSPNPQASVQENGLEQSGRLLDGFDSPLRPGLHPYHSLPHQPHGASRPTHPVGHRRQFSHPAEKISHPPHVSHRPKLKPRPLSSGITVEPGCDPADPVAALPQNSIPRRRIKNIHTKKSRQSYPTQEAGLCVDRKVVSANTGVDLGFVEPGSQRARNPALEQDGATFGLGKRRNGERNAEREAQNVFANGQFLESHMSSYV